MMNDDDDGFREFQLYNRMDKEESRHRRRLWRAGLSEAALLTAEEVVEALPGRATTTRRWLDTVPRVRLPNGQKVFRWGEVLRHLERVA